MKHFRISAILISPLLVALTACGATTATSVPSPDTQVPDSIAELTSDITLATAEPVTNPPTKTPPITTQPPATNPPATNPPPADPPTQTPPVKTPDGPQLPPPDDSPAQPPVKTPDGPQLPPTNPPAQPPVKNPPAPQLPVPTFNSFSVSDATPCDATQPTPPITVAWDVSNATSVYVAIDNEFGPWEQDLPSSGSMELPGAGCDDAQTYYVVAQNSYGRTVMQATRTAI